MSPRASFHLVAEENGRVMHELTWILLGRLGGGIIILRTKYRDVPMGIDSIRLG